MAIVQRQSDEATKRRRARGFSFVEILFAIFILGIGFIMIAAIFPVAIQQTQATADEAMARGVAEGAVKQVEVVFNRFASTLPSTGGGTSYMPAAFNALQGSRVVAGDPRYAWVPLYRYLPSQTPNATPGTEVIPVWIIVVRSRNKPEYNEADWQALVPVRTALRLYDKSLLGSPDLVRVERPSGNSPADQIAAFNAAAEGTFMVRTDGTGFYRLGRLLNPTTAESDRFKEFELLPEEGAKDIDVAENNTVTLVSFVGRGLREPLDYSNIDITDRDGPAQDVFLVQRTVSVSKP